MTFRLDVVRFLFRQAYASIIQGIGVPETVLCLQNQDFQPKAPNVHIVENVFIYDERFYLTNPVEILGKACYDVCVPVGSESSMSQGESIARQLVDATPVGNYLRDNIPPNGTNCSVYIISSVPGIQRKIPTFPGWYMIPVETNWRSFYNRA